MDGWHWTKRPLSANSPSTVSFCSLAHTSAIVFDIRPTTVPCPLLCILAPTQNPPFLPSLPFPSSPRTSRSLPSPLSTPETKKTMESYSKKKSRKELGWSSSNLTIFLVILCILYPMYSKSIKQSRIWFRHKNSESNSQGYLLLSLFEIQVTELS